MKKRETRPLIRRRGFRMEWEGDEGGSGRLYLFGVRAFGAFEEKRKSFQTDAGSVSVYGERLTVETFRSGGVEVAGRIAGVSFDRGRGGNGLASD